MPDVYHSADVAQIRTVIHRLQSRILLQELPSLILGLVSHLRFPRMALLSPMLWVWLEWWYLVVVTSAHTFSLIVMKPSLNSTSQFHVSRL